MAQQIKKKYLSSEVISYFDDQINAVEVSVTAEETARIAGDASTLSSAQDYTDGEIDALGQALDANLQQEVSDRIAGDVATLSSANSYTDTEVSAEETARIAADAGLQSQIDAISGGSSSTQVELDATQVGAGLSSAGAYVVNASANYIGSATSLHDADQVLDSAVFALDQGLSQEQTDRIAAVSDLQDQINNVLSNVDGTALDSLTEIVTAFQAADASLNGAITALSTGLSADIDAEEAARIAADNALDARIDTLEAVVWFKEKFSIVNGQTSVTLSYVPKAGSMSAHVDRLAIHEGASEDYTISGTTMTFLNDLVSPGQSSLGNGDTVYVKYQK